MNIIKKISTFILLLFVFISLAVFSYIFSNKTKIIESLLYAEKSNIDYQVCLKDNIFYEDRCQPKDMKYIASAINYIDVFFAYDFETNTSVNYVYEYYIDGIITVFDRNDSSNILFTKNIKILDTKKNEKFKTNRFSLSESLKINYHEYNDLIKAFKSEYNISADSSLKLKLYLKNEIFYENFDDSIITNNELELTIPLTENTININVLYKDINNSDKFVQPAKKTLLNTFFFGASITFAILSVVIFVLLILRIYKSRTKKSAYEKFIANKLKNLDRMIVSAQHHIKIEEKNYSEIIDVQSFSELVDIAERLADVITWTEIKHKKETVSWFSVASSQRLYRIIYKSTDKHFK